VQEEEFTSVTGPLSIAAAETDPIFPAENRHQSEVILSKIKVPYQINLFSGVSHGFAVRGDPKVKAEKFAKERAFVQAADWFDEHLV
jgi:dienelactone hydrolase